MDAAVRYALDERLEFAEYREFLTRTDLGSQYPRKNFEARVSRVLQTVDICVTARNEAGRLIGICFGLTDFAYFLFLTDLGVDRDYARRGIGRELVRLAIEQAGGPDDITVTTISNDEAIDFYKRCEMVNEPDLVVRYCRDWESFVVE